VGAGVWVGDGMNAIVGAGTFVFVGAGGSAVVSGSSAVKKLPVTGT